MALRKKAAKAVVEEKTVLPVEVQLESQEIVTENTADDNTAEVTNTTDVIVDTAPKEHKITYAKEVVTDTTKINFVAQPQTPYIK